MILSLTNLVASAMEVNHSEANGEEKWRSRGSGQRLSPLDRARAWVRHIFSESTYAHPLCLRCEGEGHIAKYCCRSLVCFACEEIGHKSRNCRKVINAYTHFNIAGDGENQGIQKSQWIWQRKDNQKREENEKMGDVANEKHKKDDGNKHGMSFVVVPVQSNVINIDTKDVECIESKEEMRSSHQKEIDNTTHNDEAYMGQGQCQCEHSSSSKNYGSVENGNNLQLTDLGVGHKGKNPILDQKKTSTESGDSKILREIEIHSINSFKEAINEIEEEKSEVDENTRIQKMKKGKSKKKMKKKEN